LKCFEMLCNALKCLIELIILKLNYFEIELYTESLTLTLTHNKFD